MVIGGYIFDQQQRCQFLNSIEIINLEDPNIRCQPIVHSFPIAVSGGGVFLNESSDVVMVCGGKNCGDLSIDTCKTLNAQEGIWLPGPFMVGPRADFASSLVGNDWVITGGVPSEEPNIQFFNGNVFQGVTEPNLDIPTTHCQVTIDMETIFIAGGEDVFFYNFVSGDIEILDTAPTAALKELGVNCGLITNAGGEKEVVAFQREESAIFSISSKKWRNGPSAPGIHNVMATVQLEDTFVVVGGSSGPPTYTPYDTIFLFNATTHVFDLIEQRLLQAREETMALAVPDAFVSCQ